jgi:hypothetical protein
VVIVLGRTDSKRGGEGGALGAQVSLPKGSSDNDQTMLHDNFRRLTLTSVLVPISACLRLSSVLTKKSSRKRPPQSSGILQTPTPWGQLTISTCVDRTPNVTCGSSLACLETCKACHFTLPIVIPSLKTTKSQSYSSHPHSYPHSQPLQTCAIILPGPICNKYLQIITPTRHICSIEDR